MSRTNFRVKVDLTEYYHDARRLCCVFIDETKMSLINHIQNHIMKLFSLTQPFHLVLNEADYLPPDEDVRVLKENETIRVVPGTGLENESTTLGDSLLLVTAGKIVINQCDKEAQTTSISLTKTEPVATFEPQAGFNNSLVTSKRDISSVDPTFHSIIDESDVDITIDSRLTNGGTMQDCNSTNTESSKRKRVRHKKSKKQCQLPLQNTNDYDVHSKKPKIIDSLVISSGKHIRFDTPENISNLENDESIIAKQIVNEVSINGLRTNNTSLSPGRELSTLLALRNSSTPLTFSNKKIKEEVIKTEETSKEESKQVLPFVTLNKTCTSISTNETSEKETNERTSNITLTDIDLQTYPIMKTNAKVNDIIAFQTLKLGKDFTPQLSRFIVARVLCSYPETATYVLKILKGVDEMQFPNGKFSITEEENSFINDTITLKHKQIIDPRCLNCALEDASTT